MQKPADAGFLLAVDYLTFSCCQVKILQNELEIFMNEIVDIVGKVIEKEKEAIFLSENGVVYKGTIKAFNKIGQVQIEESMTAKYIVVKTPSKSIYVFPDPVNLEEVFDMKFEKREKKPTERDFFRQLAVAKSIFGEGVLEGDKVLFADGDELKLGRTIRVIKDSPMVIINANKDKVDVSLETNGKNLYVLVKDYYIKEKSAYA